MATILLDCDGVLLNWREPFSQWLHRYDFIDSPDNWTSDAYHIEGFLKCPDGYGDKLANIFNETHYASKLPAVEGAIDAVKRLTKAGFTIRVVTAFSSNYESMKLREENLNKVFGNVFHSLVCLQPGSAKLPFLKTVPIGEDVYYVEDLPAHLMEAEIAGFKVENLYLKDQPWNARNLIYNRGNWNHILNDIGV